MKQYTIKCNWKNWNNAGMVQTLETGKLFNSYFAAEREANAMQRADRDTGEYNTSYVAVELRNNGQTL